MTDCQNIRLSAIRPASRPCRRRNFSEAPACRIGYTLTLDGTQGIWSYQKLYRQSHPHRLQYTLNITNNYYLSAHCSCLRIQYRDWIGLERYWIIQACLHRKFLTRIQDQFGNTINLLTFSKTYNHSRSSMTGPIPAYTGKIQSFAIQLQKHYFWPQRPYTGLIINWILGTRRALEVPEQ